MRIPLALCLIAMICFVGSAQDTTTHDPLQDAYGGHPVLANSVEMILMTDARGDSGKTVPSLQVIDVDSSGQLVGNDWGGAPAGAFASGSYADIISDDFDGDGSAEVVTGRVTTTGGLVLECWKPARVRPGNTWQWVQTGTLITSHTSVGGYRFRSARLEYSTRKQLIVMGIPRDSVVLKVYSFDHGITELGMQAFRPCQLWDVGFGDFDGDGLDEFIRIAARFPPNAYDTLVVQTARYDPVLKNFTREPISLSWSRTSLGSTWSRFKIITGDFRHLGHDEAALSLSDTFYGRGEQQLCYVDFSTPGTPSLSLWFNTYITNTASGVESDAIVVDLNPLKDDGDEVVVCGPGGMGILKYVHTGVPAYYWGWVKLCWSDSIHSAPASASYRQRVLAVGDIDPDTSSREWTNEIMLAQLATDMTASIRIFQPVLDANNGITGMSQKSVFATGKVSGRSELVVGDLDGDAIRFGTPRLVTMQSFVQPIIVMGGPPMHFDYLNGRSYDLCNAYDTVTVRKFEVILYRESGIHHAPSDANQPHLGQFARNQWRIRGAWVQDQGLRKESVREWVLWFPLRRQNDHHTEHSEVLS
jgi:hypothetical protein